MRRITEQTEVTEREQQLGVAFTEGRIAGYRDVNPNFNPHDLGTELHAEWERGRLSAIGSMLERRVAAARKVA